MTACRSIPHIFAKMLFWIVLSIAAGSPLAIPEKLRLYQNVTEIDDVKLMNIFEKSLERKLTRYSSQVNTYLK